ncbi:MULTISPECIES: Rz1-like lysis system protein LysC [Serratia]|uniref:Rz1-like lysis system protein LysC n=1 Tax=Serratia TaxID=613 RepID=UPI003B5CB0EA
MKRLKTNPALVGLCLSLCLSSCARPPEPPPAPLILLPPESVFTTCDRPQLQGDTWGHAVSYTLALQTALLVCSSQVETLQKWRNSYPQ